MSQEKYDWRTLNIRHSLDKLLKLKKKLNNSPGIHTENNNKKINKGKNRRLMLDFSEASFNARRQKQI